MIQDPNTNDIVQLFTREGRYLCARWGRPVAPAIFGLEDESLGIFRAALRAVLADIGHSIVETDPEMGVNLMMFFVRDWDDLAALPDLGGLTGQQELPARLKSERADQYRIFRFDPDGGIRACLTFVNMGGALGNAHPGLLAETLAIRSMLTFARDVTPSPTLARVLRAAYDPVMPVAAHDPSHGLRLAARTGPAP